MRVAFSLKYQLSPGTPTGDALVEALASLGVRGVAPEAGVPGRVALDFLREADSILAAIGGAALALQEALPGAYLVDEDSEARLPRSYLVH